MSEQEADRSIGGFEFEGRFYKLTVSDCGKDLMLIDRISGMPMSAFYEAADDAEERGRGPIILTLLATSLRAAHPDWSVERIFKKVMNLSLGDDVTFVIPETEAEEEEGEPERPLAPPTDDSETSPSNGSLSSPVPMAATSGT